MVCALFLSGCVDVSLRLELNDDGGGALSSSIVTDPMFAGAFRDARPTKGATVREFIRDGKYHLAPASYRWQARAVDAKGEISPWVEFGRQGTEDFNIAAQGFLAGGPTASSGGNQSATGMDMASGTTAVVSVLTDEEATRARELLRAIGKTYVTVDDLLQIGAEIDPATRLPYADEIRWLLYADKAQEYLRNNDYWGLMAESSWFATKKAITASYPIAAPFLALGEFYYRLGQLLINLPDVSDRVFAEAQIDRYLALRAEGKSPELIRALVAADGYGGYFVLDRTSGLGVARQEASARRLRNKGIDANAIFQLAEAVWEAQQQQDSLLRDAPSRALMERIGRARLPELMIVSKLWVEAPPYQVGKPMTARFGIKNRGEKAVILDVLTVGGRLNNTCPNNMCPDFQWKRNVTMQPNAIYPYEGTFTPNSPGKYQFFTAYRTPDGNWNTGIPTLSEGVSNTLDIVVEDQSGPTALPAPSPTVPGKQPSPGSSTSSPGSAPVVQSNSPPTVSFSAIPDQIKYLESSTLVWNAKNVKSCKISGGTWGTFGSYGFLTVFPKKSTTYAVTCVGPGGSASSQVTVTVSEK